MSTRGNAVGYLRAPYLTALAIGLLPTPGMAEAPAESDILCPTLTVAAFTSAVQNRVPLSELTEAPVNLSELFFYTAVTNGEGTELHHRWSYNNTRVADVSLEVGSDFWRTWSSKSFANLALEPGGQWQVDVTTASGCTLGQWTLTLVEADISSGFIEAQPAMQPEETNTPVPSTPAPPHNSPVDLQEIYAAIKELLELGDSSGARRAIKLARERTLNPDQLEELDALETDSNAFARLSQLIRQRDIAGARQLLAQLMISVPQSSPVYSALQSRRELLEQLGATSDSHEGFQSVANNP